MSSFLEPVQTDGAAVSCSHFYELRCYYYSGLFLLQTGLKESTFHLDANEWKIGLLVCSEHLCQSISTLSGCFRFRSYLWMSSCTSVSNAVFTLNWVGLRVHPRSFNGFTAELVSTGLNPHLDVD